MNYSVAWIDRRCEMAQFACLVDAVMFARHLGEHLGEPWLVWPIKGDSVTIRSAGGQRMYMPS